MNDCSFRNGGCSHLCIPIPGGRTCACPDNMIKHYDGVSCVNKKGQKSAETKYNMYKVV